MSAESIKTIVTEDINIQFPYIQFFYNGIKHNDVEKFIDLFRKVKSILGYTDKIDIDYLKDGSDCKKIDSEIIAKGSGKKAGKVGKRSKRGGRRSKTTTRRKSSKGKKGTKGGKGGGGKKPTKVRTGAGKVGKRNRIDV